jgi:hypothetical protein
MPDCYDTIWRFPNSEKGAWLRGLLKETGHGNFVLSGPWNASGEPVGVFGNPLEAFHLLLTADGSVLVLRAAAHDKTLADRHTVQLLVPLPVAQRFAEDLGSARLWATLRAALHVEGATPRFAPAPPVTPR